MYWTSCRRHTRCTDVTEVLAVALSIFRRLKHVLCTNQAISDIIQHSLIPQPYSSHTPTIQQSYPNHTAVIPQPYSSHTPTIQQSYPSHTAVIAAVGVERILKFLRENYVSVILTVIFTRLIVGGGEGEGGQGRICKSSENIL